MWKKLRHIRHHGPMLAALGGTMGRSLIQRVRPSAPQHGPKPKEQRSTARSRRTVKQLPRDLINEYLEWCGTDPDRYAGTIPPHLFPQWTIPVLGEAVSQLPYPIERVLNAGCRMTVLAPLPAGEPLLVSASAPEVQDDGHRALIRTRTSTGTRVHGELLAAEILAIVPLGQRRKGPSKERPRAPERAEIIGRHDLRRSAGLEYACLTGDFNPIHWLAPFARASGFKSTILHGFASMALAYESLVGARGKGDPWSLRMLDVRFTRPLTLPQEVGVYLSESSLIIAPAPGEQAYLTGTFELADGSC